MVAWKKRLARLGRVESMDYSYQRSGKKSPDRPPVLVATHRAELERVRAGHHGPIVLIGKSMGGRMGCHLAVELGANGPIALVCLGYPLVGQNGAVRDAVLLELRTPVLFVQGSRDTMCPLPRLAEVRERMQAPSELYVVADADHSLLVSRARLKADQTSQAEVDERVRPPGVE